MRKQNAVNLHHIVVFLLNEVADDQIKFTAVCQGITGSANQIPCFIQVQFQSQRQGYGGGLGWFIMGIVPDFGKVLLS